MANIMDLLSDYKNTIVVNDNISLLYIAYQFFLMVSTILGPSTIIIAIANAIWETLGVELWVAYFLSAVPAVFFLAITFTTKTKTQLAVASALSVLYACIMVIVLVAIIQSFALISELSPTLIFTIVVAGCFLIAGLFHPYEVGVLSTGLLYYFCIPSAYLLLMIYSLSNMHVVAWGTREVPKKKTKAQLAKEAEEAKRKSEEAAKKKKTGILSWFTRENLLQDVKDIISQIFTSSSGQIQTDQLKLLQKIHDDLKKLNAQMSGRAILSSSSDDEAEGRDGKGSDMASKEKGDAQSTKKKKQKKILPPEPETPSFVDDPLRPRWTSDPIFGLRNVEYLDYEEEEFWNNLLKKYLKPLKKDEEREKKSASELINARNNVSFGFWFVNLLWTIFNFMVQRDTSNRVNVFGAEIQPQGLVFILFFLIILALQLICMFIHRWGTFLQLISITDLTKVTKRWLKKTKTEQLSAAEAIEFSRELQKPLSRYIPEPLPDYDLDPEPQAPDTETNIAENGSRPSGLRHRKTLKNTTPLEFQKSIKNHLREFRERELESANDIPPVLPPRRRIKSRYDGLPGGHALSRALRRTLKASKATEGAQAASGMSERFRSSRHRPLTASTSLDPTSYIRDNAFERYFDNRIDRFLSKK